MTTTITANSSIQILAVTTTGYYATVPITVGTTYVEGNYIPLDIISLCVNCTVDMNYYMPSMSTNLNSIVDVSSTYISISGEINVLELGDFWTDANILPITTVVTGGSTPTCYVDSGLTTTISLTECG